MRLLLSRHAPVVTMAVTLAVTSLGLAGCNRDKDTTPPESSAASPLAEVEGAGAADEGEGDDLDGLAEPDDEGNLPAPAGADVTKITFDADEPNPGPTEHVVGRPKRPTHGSMITPDVLSGPK